MTIYYGNRLRYLTICLLIILWAMTANVHPLQLDRRIAIAILINVM